MTPMAQGPVSQSLWWAPEMGWSLKEPPQGPQWVGTLSGGGGWVDELVVGGEHLPGWLVL